MGRVLSKSKLIAYRQCPKRLWLEVHRPIFLERSVARNRSLSGVLLPATLTRNNPPPVQSGGTRSDPSDGKPQQVAAA